jgi:hypothetical protein
VAPGEERGSWPLVVTASGTFRSAFADKPIPPPAPAPPGFEDDASARLRESAPARLVVSGSADFVANNVAFMLNLTDWMAQDTSLIDIRSKQVRTPVLEPLETAEDRAWRAFNLLAGSAAMLLLGLGRAARAALVARRSAA